MLVNTFKHFSIFGYLRFTKPNVKNITIYTLYLLNLVPEEPVPASPYFTSLMYLGIGATWTLSYYLWA